MKQKTTNSMSESITDVIYMKNTKVEVYSVFTEERRYVQNYSIRTV